MKGPLVVLVALVVVAGCGDDDGQSEPSPYAVAEQVATDHSEEMQKVCRAASFAPDIGEARVVNELGSAITDAGGDAEIIAPILVERYC